MMDKFVKFFSKKPRIESLDNAGTANDDTIYVRLTEVCNFDTVLQRLHITRLQKYLYRNMACCERD
jgi:hypothetical protein